jgi:hypothetical protein
MKKTLVQEDKDVSEMNYQQDAPTFQFNRWQPLKRQFLTVPKRKGPTTLHRVK